MLGDAVVDRAAAHALAIDEQGNAGHVVSFAGFRSNEVSTGSGRGVKVDVSVD